MRKPAPSIGGWSSWYPPREATQRSPSTASATRARRSAEVVTTDDEKRRDADVQLIDPCWKSLRRPPSGWCQPAPQAAATVWTRVAPSPGAYIDGSSASWSAAFLHKCGEADTGEPFQQLRQRRIVVEQPQVAMADLNA